MTDEDRAARGREAAARRGDETETEAAEVGEADDPKLTAMRAVWLAMRDEEPPGRGLAELMAAARTQAAAMAPQPTLWHRLMAGLRRPPVLALASALVVLGGAAVVARQTAQDPVRMEAQSVGVERASTTTPAPTSAAAVSPAGSTAVTPAAPSAGSAGAVGGDALGGAAGGGAVAPASPAAEPPAASKPASPAAEPPVASRPASPAATPPAVTAPSSRDAKRKGPEVQKDGKLGAKQRPADPSEGTASKGEEVHAQAPRAPAQPPITTRGGSRRERSPRSPSRVDDLSGPDALEPPNDAVPSSSAPRGSPTPTAEQLGKQCEAAAQRGDCATARRLLGRITATDRAYSTRLARDEAVAKCLAE